MRVGGSVVARKYLLLLLKAEICALWVSADVFRLSQDILQGVDVDGCGHLLVLNASYSSAQAHSYTRLKEVLVE